MTHAGRQRPVDEPLADVVQRMHDHRVGSVVVVDGAHPVGIVTERDVLRLVAAATHLGRPPVGDVMTDPVDTIERDLDARCRPRGACAERGYRHMPVTEEASWSGVRVAARPHAGGRDRSARGTPRAEGRGRRRHRGGRRARRRGLLPLPPVLGDRAGRAAAARGRVAADDRRRPAGDAKPSGTSSPPRSHRCGRCRPTSSRVLPAIALSSSRSEGCAPRSRSSRPAAACGRSSTSTPAERRRRRPAALRRHAHRAVRAAPAGAGRAPIAARPTCGGRPTTCGC